MKDYAKEQRDRIEAEKKKRLETIEIEGQTEQRKNATDDGNKRAQDIHEEVIAGEDYPFEEANDQKKPKRAKKVESEQEKSPLQ